MLLPYLTTVTDYDSILRVMATQHIHTNVSCYLLYSDVMILFEGVEDLTPLQHLEFVPQNIYFPFGSPEQLLGSGMLSLALLVAGE